MTADTEPPEPPPPPGSSLTDRLIGWLRSLPARIVTIAALFLLLYLLFVQPPPIWPFVTSGRIYVESPGIYTRERLVNDRYAQDFWLKTQLEKVDKTDDLLREYRVSKLEVGVDGAQSPAAEAVVLAFQDEFLLRTAIRDKIRQEILENLLDDRHDLTGNSIYGLKFDTAVVPGRNTYDRPYVVVRINAETLPSGREAIEFLGDPTSAHNVETGGDFDATRQQYNAWLLNVENRLNGYLEQATDDPDCDVLDGPVLAGASTEAEKEAAFAATATTVSAPAPEPDSPMEDGWVGIDPEQILAALRHVLGVERREASFTPWRKGGLFATVEIPRPWSRYFELRVRRGERTATTPIGCGGRASITLVPVFATLLMVDDKEWDAFDIVENKDRPQVLRVGWTRTDDGPKRVVIYQVPNDEGTWRHIPAEKSFVESLTEPELMALRGRSGPPAFEGCLVFAIANNPAWIRNDKPVEQGDCILEGERYVVHASQYDFIRAIAQSIPYSYAVFPRGDVEGVLADRALAAGVEAPGASADALGLSGLFQTREVGAEAVVVNFAGGQSSEVGAGDFDFGWAIVKPGRQRPRQTSQLVLVSVPAYLNELEIWVETGWLDRNSNPIGPPPQWPRGSGVTRAGARELTRMTVALPPEYEAIDTLVVGGTRRQGPVINDLYFADRPVTVRACRAADILIPGERLWRSTSVTLGGQIANKITVMPDMRGIVASFNPVGFPFGVPAGGLESAETLAVWTSEGRDELLESVTVMIPEDVARAGGCPTPG